MSKEKLVYAKNRRCEEEGCKNKGFKFFGLADPDADLTVLCRKHLKEAEMRVYIEISKIDKRYGK